MSSQSADLVPFDGVAALGESGDVVAYALRNPVPAGEDSAPADAAAGTEDSNLSAEENSAPADAAAGTGNSTVSPSEDAAAPTENVEAEL